jgi:hypothetical protein
MQTAPACGFSALESLEDPSYGRAVKKGEFSMKKLAIAMVAMLSLLSIAGCTTAPPPPTVTKG